MNREVMGLYLTCVLLPAIFYTDPALWAPIVVILFATCNSSGIVSPNCCPPDL